MNDIKAIESAIGLTFLDKNLLWQSLTHTTYARFIGTPEAHNGCLAILGDTLLDLIVVEHLYKIYGNQHGKQFISDERDKLVNKDENLNLFSEKICLNKLVRAKKTNDLISSEDIIRSFKALLAAIYLDQGLGIAQNWFINQFLSHLDSDRSKTIENKLSIVDIAVIEKAISHEFCNEAFLQTAITERSYAVRWKNAGDHNEGLALLGDSLLDFIVLEYLYNLKGKYGKGKLSSNRDKLVKDNTLEFIANRLGLARFIRHDGMLGTKNLTDGLEAILGAIYLDGGLNVSRDWLFRQIPKEIITQIENQFCQDESMSQFLPANIFSTDSLISSIDISYSKLNDLLSKGQWQDADLETKELMLRVVGEVNYLPSELIDTFPCDDLEIIDQLWTHYSEGRFGFSIQVKILKEVEEIWDSFGDRVGWRVNQVWQSKNDRIYDLNAPKGHLPSAAIRAAGKGAKTRMQVLKRAEICRL
ncbi:MULTISPECIES: GUN4 domain-containing protein [Pseudanabaena]|uniref:GUN4 domain protein n=2 Tax=Pseudanabaena TaxID=1152 RepID=L8N5S7_9CYAN|nr:MULTISPECIES: GUN4 domain-containing protein [Pseudanabaena]ELS34479.1 GUN4 domain protein [Pseudanabaena biceps PCC 7429]MDG3493348.1 GUN4 domain-containing protein [Pseudanabaena catenata USMAC16]